MILGVGEVQENRIAAESTYPRWEPAPEPARDLPYYCSELELSGEERSRFVLNQMEKTIADTIASGALDRAEGFLEEFRSEIPKGRTKLSQIESGCVEHPYWKINVPKLKERVEEFSKVASNLEAKLAQAKAKRDGTQPPAGDAGAGAGAGAGNGSIVPGVSNMALLSLAAVGAFLFILSSKD